MASTWRSAFTAATSISTIPAPSSIVEEADIADWRPAPWPLVGAPDTEG
jgi:hypothetical protein